MVQKQRFIPMFGSLWPEVCAFQPQIFCPVNFVEHEMRKDSDVDRHRFSSLVSFPYSFHNGEIVKDLNVLRNSTAFWLTGADRDDGNKRTRVTWPWLEKRAERHDGCDESEGVGGFKDLKVAWRCFEWKTGLQNEEKCGIRTAVTWRQLVQIYPPPSGQSGVDKWRSATYKPQLCEIIFQCTAGLKW